MSVDDLYAEPPVAVEPPRYDIEKVLALLRANQPAPAPVAPRAGFLDRLGSGLSQIQAPGGGGHAGDVFGANLLAGVARGFGGNRVAARDAELKRQVDEYERGNAQKAVETQAQIAGIGKDYDTKADIAKRTATAKGTKPSTDVTITPGMAKRYARFRGLEGQSLSRSKYEDVVTDKPEKPGGGDGPSDWEKKKFSLSGLSSTTTAMRQDPEVQNFVGRRQGYDQIKASANANNAAGDLSLIYGFVRLQDPNAVKEGEFQNVEDAQGKLSQYTNLPTKWRTGNRLTPEFRKQLVAQARRQYNAIVPGYNSAVNTYRGHSKLYEFDPAELPFSPVESEADPATLFQGVQGGASQTPTRPKSGGWFEQNAPGGR